MARDKKEIRNELSQLHGIDFSEDFHILNSNQVLALRDKAKEVGYRAPKNASGSPARCFFYYLNRGK